MLILAGVSINAIIGENGLLKKAQVATVASKFAAYKEQLELNAFDDEEVYASGANIKNYIPTMEEVDIEKFVIMKRALMYINNDKLEIEAAQKVGIQTADTGEEGSASAIKEVKAIISGVVNLGSIFNVPEDDFTETINTNDNSKGLMGIRLYDKNSVNSETWNIVIEYDNENKEISRYGSGYYWLKAGETYIIDGEAKKFENDFIIDYGSKQYIVLSGRAVNWNLNSTIAVTEGMILNLDPMTFADGEWIVNEEDSNFKDFYVTDTRTGRKENKQIQKTGDVEYDATSRALKFNESEENTVGEGGYLKLLKPSNFKDGVTFELYCNLSRLRYDVEKRPNWPSLGIFIKIPYLGANFGNSFSFGYNGDGVVLRFGEKYAQEFESESGILRVGTNGRVYSNSNIFELNKDLYYTVVYMRYYDESADEYMSENRVDKILIYINGDLYDEVYYSSEAYDEGIKQWNLETSPVFIGVTPWGSNDINYFLKGLVYTNRLYNGVLNAEQVKDNYNTTLKYRSSF